MTRDRKNRYHEARVDGGSDVTAQRIPTFRVEEVPELLEVSVDQKLGGTIVEPRVELMDDGLVTDDAEDTYETGH